MRRRLGHHKATMAIASEMPAAAPVLPLGLAAYQEGAVVSRTLLKRAGGTITLFAFDEGQALSEHTAPFDAVAQVLEGEAEITIAGTPLTVRRRRNGADAGQSAARGARAHAVQDAVDDDPLGLIRSGRRQERVAQDSDHIHRVDEGRGQQGPCGGADERNGVEGKAARQRGDAEQPQHEHEFLPAAPGHLVLRRDGTLVSGVGVRPIPREDRQQSPFHADDHLRQESDEAEDTVRHRDAQRVRRWLRDREPDAKQEATASQTNDAPACRTAGSGVRSLGRARTRTAQHPDDLREERGQRRRRW